MLFSPNGDGINDTWVITNLTDYQGNVVEVFNRYGQQVHPFNRIWNTVGWKGAMATHCRLAYIIIS